MTPDSPRGDTESARAIVYQSAGYAPERVTGRYARRQRKGLYRVFEAATGTGRFAGKPGMGPTLREWETDGSDIPADVRERLDASRVTQEWPL